jgi:hypothetical protein
MYQQPVKTTTELLSNTDDSKKSHADIIAIPVLEINIPENELNSSIGQPIVDLRTPPPVEKSIFDQTTILLPTTNDSTEEHAQNIERPVMEINILEDEFNTTELDAAETQTSDKPTIILKLNSIYNHSFLFPPCTYL